MSTRRASRSALAAVLIVLAAPLPAIGQESKASEPREDAYVPIAGAQRIYWIVDGTIGLKSLTIVGPLAAGWQTAWNTPEEWGRSWSGVAKRYAEREVDVAISNSLEGGLGAIWGEDPRYIRSARKGLWPRVRYALKTSVLAPGRNGRLRPAWARYAGNTVNNVIENAWLPPSQTTATMTAVRSGLGIATRMGGNLFEEFWPDVVRHFRKK
jgi:hypothetical protein